MTLRGGLYIGYLNAFWDPDKQMWHDKISKCYVYYVEDESQDVEPREPF